MRTAFLCIISGLFFSQALYSSDFPEMSFEHFSVDEGLHNSIVYRIIQDGQGVLWFGLHDGIDRYNGYDFKHFELSSGKESSAYAHKKVHSIFRRTGDEFWISSGSDLLRYDLHKDKFQPVVTGLSSSKEVNQIQDLCIVGDSLCYIGTNQGMFIYDIGSGELTDLTNRTTSIIRIHQVDQMLWIGTGWGITYYDIRKGAFSDPIYDEEILAELRSVHAMSFFTDPLREFTLIGTRQNGLLLFDHLKEELSQILDQSLEYSHIRSLNKYGDHYLIGMDGKGLAILDPEMKLTAHYVHDEDKRSSISSNGIYDLHVDDHERIWISTYGGGVNVYDPNKKAFHVHKHESNMRNSLRNNVIRSILETDRGMVFGTAKGVSMLDHQGNWKHIPHYSSEREPKVVLDMCLDRERNIWFGTFGKGVEVRSTKGILVKRLQSSGRDSPRLTTDYIFEVMQDSREQIWMGGIRGGLMVYDPDRDSIQSFEGLVNVHGLIESYDKQIVVGNLEGIHFISHREGGYQLESDQDTLLTAIRMRVFTIHESRPGEFWIGTEGSGIYHYDRVSGRLDNITREDGLPSDIVYGILEDDERRIWISTTGGLAVYEPETEQIRTYTVADGIPGKDFNYGAYYRSADGTMYFGSNKGVSYFRPEEIRGDRITPKLIFTGIEVLGLPSENPQSPAYEVNINETEQISLKHNQNSLSIEFAAINYTSNQNIKYRWKLSGGSIGEGQWTSESMDRKADLAYLPPGNYLFSVIASNPDETWSQEGIDLGISIEQPLWNTLFARISYAILLLLFFISLQKYILVFIKGRQAKEKIQFFINVAHDIRTPLTLITAPMSKLLDSSRLDKDEKEEIRVAAKNSDKLKSLLDQLLEFQKAAMDKQVLKVGEWDLCELLREVTGNFQPLLDEHLINARLTLAPDPFPAWIDRQKIEKILYNLISNAIKYSHRGGVVEITLEKKDGRVVISVRDEGRGIPQKQQKEIFKRYFRAQNAINSREAGSGVGLMLSKKLIELHKGKIRFSSTENAGSEFSIEFPWERSAYRGLEIMDTEVRETYPVDGGELEEVTFSQEYTVLVVEDNKELRHYLRNNLSSQYNVLTASNGSKAYQTILNLDVDLIISDIMMPEMDGRVLCQKVRANIATSHIPIILLTALGSVQDKIQGLEQGADDYIEKPFEIEHLKVKVANILKARERLRKRFLEHPGSTGRQDIPNKPDQQLMLKLNDEVGKEVLSEDFSVQDMCRLVGMSRPVLYRKLKAYTGHSPQEYMIIMRLNHASRSFREGHMSVKEVAYESGFTDPKYFSKSFKKHFGVSPSEYIRTQGDPVQG